MSLYQRIQADVRGVKPSIVLTTALIWPLYAVGWIAGKVARIVWNAALWLLMAGIRGVREGWAN